MPAFSPAMAAWVSPRRSVCSSSMVVMQVTRRLAGVGGVEPSAEPDLEHRVIHPGLAEQQQRGGGRGVEEGRCQVRIVPRAQRLDVGTHALHRVGQELAADGRAVDAKALGPALEVRRGEDAGAQPPGAQHRFGQQRRRALALRAGHVQHGELALRIAEARQQGADRIQREAPVGPVGSLLDVDQALEPGGGLLDRTDRGRLHGGHGRLGPSGRRRGSKRSEATRRPPRGVTTGRAKASPDAPASSYWTM